MRNPPKTICAWIISLTASALLLIAVPTSARAATIDEIISMHDAGLPAEVIIQVIEATGLDEPLDIDTLNMLSEHGLDSEVLSYLTKYLPSEAEGNSEESSAEPETSHHSNWAGGEGFHHDNSKYGPWDNSYRGNDYREGPRYGNDYYPPLGSISIYEPPVYFLNNRPYRHAYRAPHLYGYRPGWWSGGQYIIPDGFFYNPYFYLPPSGMWPHGYYDGWMTGDDWGADWFGRWRHGHGRSDWDSSLGAWFRNDDFSISIHF
jgi:hypothetical protein